MPPELLFGQLAFAFQCLLSARADSVLDRPQKTWRGAKCSGKILLLWGGGRSNGGERTESPCRALLAKAQLPREAHSQRIPAFVEGRPCAYTLPFQKTPQRCQEKFFLRGQLPAAQSFDPKASAARTKLRGAGSSIFSSSLSPPALNQLGLPSPFRYWLEMLLQALVQMKPSCTHVRQ
ncbi:hypothetical protein HJG60_008788 [Phyllostomus discolor]|uniref:Uncharacterized protein n=1 Tax=Phyllostomus discolor TaxID=89673 RepID=A0A834DJ54_9CHIR|nr:hypothetical protein HJG60_008788 [Phyllostomus discolor]